MPEPVPYKVVRVESWEAFLDLITDSPYSNWAFRGQREEFWPLLTTISRHFRDFQIEPEVWPQQEERILRIFKRKAHHFLTHPPDSDDEFQWLALMKHHGAPTRLLDLTWSPYVAAFFALERCVGEAAVWALNPSQISLLERQTVRKKRIIRPRKMDLRLRGNYRRYYLQGQIPFLHVGEPQAMNLRLIAQSGTFAIPGILTESMEEILSGYPDPENTLVKFILPSEKVRDKGLRELYRMNITNATLFPDLDGLARSLAYELEFHWAYKTTRKDSASSPRRTVTL
ncbi:MAG: FRG domain-containing protein [Bryobacteraceae bacterium]